MAASEKLTTTVSTKGQVILPKAVRDERAWNAGTRLVVERTREGVLLREEARFPRTRLEDVVGLLSGPGPVLTIEQMDEAVAAEFADVLAIDTNIVVRVLRGDDVEQTARAVDLLASQEVLLLSTIVLEAEWVLRSAYKLDRLRVVEALKAFSALNVIVVQEPRRLMMALDWATKGMAFADAYHLAGAEECEAFITFDRDLIRSAAVLGQAVREP